MKRNIKLYLQDIWESTLAIEEYTQNLAEEEFYSNRQVQDAIIRRLEIIGEAVKNIDDDFRNKYPQIPMRLHSSSVIPAQAGIHPSSVIPMKMGIHPLLSWRAFKESAQQSQLANRVTKLINRYSSHFLWNFFAI